MVSFTWRRLALAVNFGLFVSTVSSSQLSRRACTRTVKAKQGDTCASLSNSQGISVSEFLLDNPTITSCDLTAGTDYCVAADSSGVSPSPPSPTPSLVISTDGTCGNGVTCAGSKWGGCCSEHGYCGSTNDYCSGGCQVAFGSCGAVSSSTSSGPIMTLPPTSPGTVWVTATTVITSTAVSSLTRTTTIAVPATITSVVLTTSTVVRTASSIALTTSVVTATSIVTRTASSIALVTSTAVVTATNVVQVTATSILTTTSVVTRTVASTSITTYTSLVFATSTSLVFDTSTRVVTSTSLIVRTATSLVLGTSTVTSTVTADRTAVTTTIVSGACSPTKPDTPITRTTSSRPPTQTPSDVPNPVFPGTISNCKKYYQIRNRDTCQSIVGSNGITFAQFYAWNPSVSCDSLWEDYYVCIGA